MSIRVRRLFAFTSVLLAVFVLAACSNDNGGAGDGGTSAGGDGSCTPADTPVINFAAYSTPREVYGKIIPAFQSAWKEDHDDQSVIFQESYAGSTTQSQNVVNGYPADIVALSLAPDVDAIADAGLITHDWTSAPDGGMVSTSVAVFDVQPGNPLGLEDWNDLTDAGVEVLTPDPAQSGGARWNLVAAWGAALRGHAGVQKDDEAGATDLLNGIFANVLTYDKSARDSIQNFEAGNGNVAITYENEVKTANKAGLDDEAVYPPSTVLIENPVAVVDTNAADHCVTDIANAFVDFLHTPEVKDLYSSVGFLRSTDATKAKAGDPANGFPAIDDLFTVADLGGWDALNDKLFSDSGIVTQGIANAS
jgi:sulfate/thiosulfate transport system substrate-binding protein